MSKERARNLVFLVHNSRFLILPWVRGRGLASKILAGCARQLPGDWERRYGYRPLLLETLVDSRRFAGACCWAANWVALGDTSGRGRMDRYHEADGSARKLVLVYPLLPECSAAAPGSFPAALPGSRAHRRLGLTRPPRR